MSAWAIMLAVRLATAVSRPHEADSDAQSVVSTRRGEEAVLSWPRLIEGLQSDARQADKLARLVASARQVVDREIVRRVYTLEDIGKHRTWLDGRARNHDPATKQIFELAMSDFFNTRTVEPEMPLLATAYRITGEEMFLSRLLAQLREVAT